MYMRYNGVTITATKRMSNNWQAVYSLVLSKAEGRLGSSARATSTTTQSSQAGTFGRDAGRAERLRQHRWPAGRRSSGRQQAATQSTGSRSGILVAANLQHQTGRFYARAGSRQRPRLPGSADHQHGSQHRRPPGAGRQHDRRPRAEGHSPRRARTNFGVFLDALNLNNSDQSEGVGSALGTSAVVRLADAVHPAAPGDVRRQVPLVGNEFGDGPSGPFQSPWREHMKMFRIGIAAL